MLLPVTALDFDSGRLCLLATCPEPHLAALCRLAAAGAPPLPLLEGLDMGDALGDGGGDLETSPLSLALYVALQERAPERLAPLPLCISPQRRANVLLRSAYVLLCHGEQVPNVVHLGDLKSLDAMEEAQ